MKKRLFSLLTVGALIFGFVTPATAATSSTAKVSEWTDFDTDKYTDRVDIDGYLNKLAEDEDFQKEAAEKIKEQAEKLNLNDEEDGDAEAGTNNFTFEGPTKYFLDINLSFKEFTQRAVGEHVEIWVANDLSFPEGDPRPPHVITQEQVDKLAAEFDQNMYPVATGFFGVPNSHDGSNSLLEELGYFDKGYYSGDGDKIIMLVDNIQDENYLDPTYPFFVAGFYWTTLEIYHDRNIITIDTNNWEERLENTFFGTTIHELQHLIHDDNDSDETTWVNEGMSTFAEFLGGYGLDEGSINFLLDHPENSLTAWDEHYSAETGPETIADYALVQLFMLYHYEQFGQEFIRDVALSELNSIEGFEEAYKKHKLKVDFNKMYRQFATALLIDEDRQHGGKYGFENIDLRSIDPDGDGVPRGKTVDLESAKLYEKDGVPAWGTDYKVLDFDGKVDKILFNGVDFLGTNWVTTDDPLGSGEQVYWGNEGDEMDNHMIFEADLTGLSEATLTFDNYIDIEEYWDYGVVQVSTDGGETWTSLANENTQSELDPNGYPKINDNLPGFTGKYDDWQTETFDLSEYAGQKVHISFRYLTDWASNETGWFVDNIAIPEIGLSFNGSSMDGLMSLSELKQEYVEYGVTFINEKNGKYKVIHVDPFNVTDEDALQLRQLFKKGNNYMHTYFAAPQDVIQSVDFEYEVILKDNKGKGKDKGKGHGPGKGKDHEHGKGKDKDKGHGPGKGKDKGKGHGPGKGKGKGKH